MIQLYEHQRKSIDEIFEIFKTQQRCLYQLATGGGKTVVFTALCKEFLSKNDKKILILCHRNELVEQTINTFVKLGITCEAITSKVKEAKHLSDIYVGMVETVYNRCKTNDKFFNEIGLIVCDECHLDVFEKCFKYFPKSKILGCTATPISMKRITFTKCQTCGSIDKSVCCGNQTYEYSKPFALASIYHNIVCGADICDLIEDGKLVKEVNYVTPYDKSKLVIDNKTGEFSNESIFESFSEKDLFNVIGNYEKYALGKKTIIFNANTQLNLVTYYKFLEKGYNIKLYDSVNTSDISRVELVEWFKNTPDAILCNVSIFTTGFDVTDVECVILNRPTASLSLFLQMVGRGGRITNKIYKPYFILIDGGGNIERHFSWSSKRDWEKIFYGENEKPKAKKERPEDVRICKECGFMYPKSENICPNCETEVVFLPKIKKESDVINVLQNEIPLPNGKAIRIYAESLNENRDFAWRILINQIFDLFILHEISKERFLKSNSKERIQNLVSKCYYEIAKLDGTNRTNDYLTNKVLSKLEKYYGI